MYTEKDYANAIRILSMDMVQKANSGHPGAPMGMADIAEVLWRKFLKYNPQNPHWANRDRFVLSNGHGSALIYSLLHLSGYDLSIDDLKEFRQLHSRTPGHPEYGYTVGIETTTGPLGQGLANAVGMALAEKVLAAEFNQPGHKIVDHHTYVFFGDGCLMEGISHEVCSLAGLWKLNKLIAFYDDNGISIDGHVTGWFGDDTEKRFQAYGWNTHKVDGHNLPQITEAIARAQTSDKPTIIICKTTIGFGSPNKAGTHAVHGSPLGAEEILATRHKLGWSNEEPFFVPKEIYQAWDHKVEGNELEAEWNKKFAAYQEAFPEQAKDFLARINRQLPADFVQKADDYIAHCQANPQDIATRKSSQNAIQAYAPLISSYFGGSADLTPSNLTDWKGCISLTKETFAADYVHYGVREFGMAAILNGLYLHSGFIPTGGTFLTFVDYARNAVRMSSLMKIQVIYVLTHDSIGVGEDGPTHQPIEHVSSLRIIPNLTTWRPADQVETAVAWKEALLKQHGPTALILTRQNLKQQVRNEQQVKDIAKGGYVLLDTGDNPEYLIVATGSEVNLAVEAAKIFSQNGKDVRVVSLPAFDVFEAQSAEYKESVFPASISKRVAVEAGSTGLWYKYVGMQGKVIGLDRFGESAPAEQLFKEFGITTDTVVNVLKSFN